MKKDVILKHHPTAKFVHQYRKRRYFHFMDNKTMNKKYFKAINNLILPYPQRNQEVIGIIYLITNKINNKKYIGQTVRALNDRITDYKRGLGNDYINNSIKKYGWNSLEFTIIDTAQTIDELNTKEIRYIIQYKSNDRKFGYNIESGGNNSIPATETLEKMSKSHLGIKQTDNWVNKRIAVKGTEEAKKYGRKKTEEDKKRLSENSPKFWLGKTRDDETRKKISETKLKNGPSQKQIDSNNKTVYKRNIITNEIVGTFLSTEEASTFENVNQSTVSRWCKNNKTIRGYSWSY